MKKIIILLAVFGTFSLMAQVPAYYSGINFAASSVDLRNALSDRITSTHTSPISYDEVWDCLKQADLDPSNSANVLLIYGYDDSDGDIENDRSRGKTLNGGSSGDWNREHTFPKSLASPDLGTSGPGSDAHNLRACDVATNGNRSNRKFADGSGFRGNVGSDWYPGDEWKGDCARIVMYMYLRYDLQCRPIYAVSGSVNAVDANMVDLLLEWNAEDDVSSFEQNRNDKIQTCQGNRNPFIDNPAIATLIWGGPQATDTWGGVGVNETTINSFGVYPNPATEAGVYVETIGNTDVNTINVFGIDGKLVYSITNPSNLELIPTDNLEKGVYFLSINTPANTFKKQVIVQ